MEDPNSKSIVMSWHDKSLATIDVSKTLDAVLNELDLTETNQFKFRMIMAELLHNAIDHGLLGLDSEIKKSADGFDKYYLNRAKQLNRIKQGSLDLSVKKSLLNGKSVIKLVIHNSGQGFDYNQMSNSEMPFNAHAGRGIKIVHSLCEEILYSDEGRKVEISFIAVD